VAGAQDEPLRIGQEVGRQHSQAFDVDLSLFEPVATQELPRRGGEVDPPGTPDDSIRAAVFTAPQVEHDPALPYDAADDPATGHTDSDLMP
jgi:hypothetical protein